MVAIKIHKDDAVNGNYLLLLSGEVKHVPGPNSEHIYIIDESQKKILDENKIRYEQFK